MMQNCERSVYAMPYCTCWEFVLICAIKLYELREENLMMNILKKNSGPEVIKLFSCSTQLSMKFHWELQGYTLFFLFLLKNIDCGTHNLCFGTHNLCFEQEYEKYQSYFFI